jgi:hypothetical protein
VAGGMKLTTHLYFTPYAFTACTGMTGFLSFFLSCMKKRVLSAAHRINYIYIDDPDFSDLFSFCVCSLL